MTKKELELKKTLLVEVYEYSQEEVDKMTEKEITEAVMLKQKSEIKKAKNPNRFWLINGLPEPDVHTTTTSKAYGAWVVAALFLVIAGFFGMFMWMAFK